ncbi:MAG: hypothetical protein V4858_18855 [Pseudomonadota bacterium]
MAHTQQTIHIHPLVPAKVRMGAPCNGCGVCCLFEPCPLGMLLSRRRAGACDALRWDAEQVQYRCGAIVAPYAVMAQSLPRGMRWLAPALAPVLRRAGLRWIAAGIGCDSSLEVAPSEVPQPCAAQNDGPSTTMPSTELSSANRSVVRRSQP